jgi:hypothetical protein
MASLLTLAPAALVLACTSTVIDGQDPQARAVAPKSPALIGTPCLAEGDTCEKHGAVCCGGLFCADYGYGQGTCDPLRPLGGYCTEGAECESGLCNEGACVDELPACVGLGEFCAGGSPCCAGYCLPNGYAPDAGTCAPLEPAGSSCGEGSQCESGICELNLCRAEGCSSTGAECFSDASCCGGFCTGGPYSYAPGACTLPQPAGAYCESWLWCASMSCVESVCAP